jgi:heat shock protein HspQ
MDFVEDDNRLVAAFEEQGRVLDRIFGFRQITVDVERLFSRMQELEQS